MSSLEAKLFRPQALMVLGMHRAGTSAVTRTINLLGADLPDNLLGKNQSNPLGHWESNDVIALNDAMLTSANSTWDDVFDFDDQWFKSHTASHWKSRIAGYIRSRLADSPMFVLKDPRLCLLFPIWAEAFNELGVDLQCIIPFRNPVEVARSLIQRDFASRPAGFIPAQYGYLLWLRYVLAAERHTRGINRTFLSFDDLLVNWQLEVLRMGKQLDLIWPNQDRATREKISLFLSREHKHHEAGNAEEANVLEPIFQNTYSQLKSNVIFPAEGSLLFDDVRNKFVVSTQFFETYVRSAISTLRVTSDSLASTRDELITSSTLRDQLRLDLVEASSEKTRVLAELSRLESEAEKTEKELAQAVSALEAQAIRSEQRDEAILAENKRIAYQLHVYLEELQTRIEEVCVSARSARANVNDLASDVNALSATETEARSAWLAIRDVDSGRLRHNMESSEASEGAIRSLFGTLRRRLLQNGSTHQRASLDPTKVLAESDRLEAIYNDRRASRRRMQELALSSESRAAELESAAVVLADEAHRFSNLARSLIRDKEIQDRIGVSEDPYRVWVEANDTLTEDDEKSIRARLSSFVYRPLISIIMRISEPDYEHVRKAIDSVKSQIYENWELCVSVNGSPDTEINSFTPMGSQEDPRVKITAHDVTIGACPIADLFQGTNGQFIGAMNGSDLLASHALFEFVAELNRDPNIDILYSDEDQIDGQGCRKSPWFKTDFNEDQILESNYVGKLLIYRHSMLKKIIEGQHESTGIHDDHDLLLRSLELTNSDRIRHVPAVLYHRRCDAKGKDFSEQSADASTTASYHAVVYYLGRHGMSAKVIKHPEMPNCLRVIRNLPSSAPLVSVIIPTRDRIDILRTCVDGVLNRTDYRNIELIIVDNDSRTTDARTYFLSLEGDPRVRILKFSGDFNYSAINNFAVCRAKGDVIAFLNNDVDVISPDWLKDMVSIAVSPGVGAVGPKLIYPDNRIQHAGIVLGVGGVANHFHQGLSDQETGYFGRALLMSTVSAVTGACLVVGKDTFERVNGFDEKNLAIAFNDVDLCLKISSSGLRNVWTPHVKLYHHESLSRGSDSDPGRKERFQREIDFMHQKWGDMLKDDPYYNPNLSDITADFSLAFPSRRTRSWVVISK